MSGNVREWCADRYADYPDQTETDPKGADNGQIRVLRGGSWIDVGHLLRSAGRDASQPDFRFRNFGFRLAGGLAPQASAQPCSANRGLWSDGKVPEQEVEQPTSTTGDPI